MSNFEPFLQNWIKQPGATKEAIDKACLNVGLTPPPDYASLLQIANGGEGFVGDSYLHLYSIEQLISLNQAYQVAEFCPGLIVFGSNGGGTAYGFDMRQAYVTIIDIPFIPMDFEYSRLMGISMESFLQELAPNVTSGTMPKHTINEDTFGKMVHEIQPVVFGGNPTDLENKTILSPEDHAAVCVFWNRRYRELRNQ